MKKGIKILIYILIGVIGLAAVGLIVYYGWRLISQRLLPVKEVPTQEEIQEEAKEKPALQIISDNQILDFWINKSNGEIYFINSGGSIGLAKETEDQILSEQNIENISKVLASPDGQKTVIVYGDANNPRFYLYDSVENTWHSLSSNIIDTTWINAENNNSNLIVLTKNNGGADLQRLNIVSTSTIVTSTIAGTTTLATSTATSTLFNFSNLIRNFPLVDYILNTRISATSTFLYLTGKASLRYPGESWSIDLSNFTIKKIAEPITGLMIKWDPTGNWGLKFYGRQTDYKLDIIRNTGGLIASVPFIALPEKCILGVTSYCFIPREILSSWQLPDDYLQKKIYFLEDLYKFNLIEPSFELVPMGDSLALEVDAYNPQLFNNKIYFINRYNQMLYELDLSRIINPD